MPKTSSTKKTIVPPVLADDQTDPHVRVFRGIFSAEEAAAIAKDIEEEDLFEEETGQMPFKPKGVKYCRKKRKQRPFYVGPSDQPKKEYIYSGGARKHSRAEKTASGRRNLQIAQRASEVIKEHLGLEVDFNTTIQTHYLAAEKGDKGDDGSLGWHRDTSPNFPADSLVCSYHVSGEERKFFLKSDSDGSRKYVVFGPNDLCVMMPNTQKTHTHMVPKGGKPRKTVTCRRVV